MCGSDRRRLTNQPVTIRPSKAHSRRLIIPVARGHYFERGGFTVNADTVTVVARSGRRTEVPVSKVGSVVLTRSTRGDLRVLLTDASGAVLAQDSAFFYSDDDLERLASAIGRRS